MSSLDEMKAFAEAAVRSKFYGFKTADEMLPLMIIAQSEGRSFASVVQEYDIISGKPSLKAEAMLARFQKSGGHIQWTELSDARCSAIFSHPQCAPVEIDWDMRRAQQAQIKNHMWAKYPRNMLKARVISDGVRTAFPACLGGLYTPEEVSEFVPAAPVSPRAAVAHLPAPPAVEVERTEAGASNANESAPASSSIEAEYDERDEPSKPAVQTLSKSNARPDFKAIVEEIRACQSMAELRKWGIDNMKRVELQPQDWRSEIRKEYEEMREGFRHLAQAADEANRALEGANQR
jgi:hypothetical protein